METLYRLSSQELDDDYAGTDEVTSESISERCDYCLAQPEQPCRNRITQQPTPIPHNCRTKKAERRRLGLHVDEPPTLGS